MDMLLCGVIKLEGGEVTDLFTDGKALYFLDEGTNDGTTIYNLPDNIGFQEINKFECVDGNYGYSEIYKHVCSSVDSDIRGNCIGIAYCGDCFLVIKELRPCTAELQGVKLDDTRVQPIANAYVDFIEEDTEEFESLIGVISYCTA